MEKITKEMIRDIYMREGKRIHLEEYESQRLKREKGTYYGHINLPFSDGIRNAGFPFFLYLNKNYFPDALGEGKQRCWRSIKTKKEFDEISNWCLHRFGYVYILSCLKSAAALGLNMSDPQKLEYTEIGTLVNNARENKNKQAVDRLVELACVFIEKHPPFGKCDFVAAIPAPESKPYDLPKILAEKIAAEIGKKDITKRFSYGGEKGKVKDVPYDQNKKAECFEKKWRILETAKMCYKDDNVKDRSVLLIDDLYQSGTTMQYAAMVLQNSGANAVFGLSMEKSLRNTGND